MPCRMRAATNIGVLMASPHSTEAVVKITMAMKNTRRVPKRSACCLVAIFRRVGRRTGFGNWPRLLNLVQLRTGKGHAGGLHQHL